MISVRQTQRVCVKVAQQTLTLYVRVRILHPLPKEKTSEPFRFRGLLFVFNGLPEYSGILHNKTDVLFLDNSGEL
jgi:hypothetical protein